MTEDQINDLLWRFDPMNTGCNVNEEMEGEYASLARDISQALSAGAAPRQAVLNAFDQAFWEGCLLDEHRVPALSAILSALNSTHTSTT
ncbi:MAG: hypothetical protein EOO29_14380 [Comamonadaceae bacterium]|nr:MAG: hypothetical protein EOO29_14380 [Comamonadaceae bacterium]